MNKFLGLIFFLLSVQVVYGQSSANDFLKAAYTFDLCDAVDDSGNNSNGLITGAECRCGVRGEAMMFDGVDDRIQFNGNVNEYFKANNFTISLYFRPVSSAINSVLLSKISNCSDPVGIVVRYGNGGIAVDLKGETGITNTINAKLKRKTCWIHLVIVRSGSRVLVYENEELIAEDDNGVRNANIANDGVLTLGLTNCSASLDKPFRGLIDELRIFNHPLSGLQIRSLDIPVDEIITQDTVVAKGTVFQPVVSHTCASQVTWKPSSAVNPADLTNTTVDIEETTELTLNFDYTDCQVEDTVLVRVVDSENIGCDEIPMPRAFTPNNDGLNDKFFIPVPASIQKMYSFEVFDRWNNRIFVTENAAEAWDGTFQGKQQNPGVFIYKIRYDCSGEVLVKTGEVLLLN